MSPTANGPPDENSPLLQSPKPDYTAIPHPVALPKSKTTTRSNVLIICATFIGVFIASIDESLVLSNFSTIASQFHRLSQGSWLLVAYNFGYCVSLPVFGALSDTYGRKNVLLISYILFALSCLACGACFSLVQLVLARVLSGVSGAGMVSLVSIIIIDLVPPNEVALYRSYENAANVVGRSVGAPLGGLLSDTIGWRWSFFGQIPLIILCTLVVLYRLPTSLNQTEDGNKGDQKSSRLRQIDFAGLFMLSATILCLLFVLETLGMKDEKQLVPTWGLAVAFVGSAMAFILTEVFYATRPLIPMNLLLRDLGGYCMTQWLVFSGRTAFVSNIVPYFTRVEKYRDWVASMMYVQLAVGVTIGSIFSGHLIKRMKGYKIMGIVSLSVTLLAFFLIFLTWRDGCNIWESLLLSVIGIAPGILFQTMFLGMSYSSPKECLSICIGTYYLFQQLGQIIGPAVGAALIQRSFKNSLVQNIVEIPHKKTIIHNIINKLRFAESLSEPLQQTVRLSYLNAFQFLPVFSLIITAAALPFSIFLKERKVN